MAIKRTDGKSKLTPEMRQRLVEVAREAGRLVYGEAGCPAWGTSFAEMEVDAKEVGQEFTRLLLEGTAGNQAKVMPAEALESEGEKALVVGAEERKIETESGPVCWPEPEARLSKSRKAFFPSKPRDGVAGG